VDPARQSRPPLLGGSFGFHHRRGCILGPGGPTRSGNQVTVSWEAVWMTEDDDRGYLIEATICQNGVLIPIAVQTDSTSYTFTDDQNCSGESRGRLYTVEKHGYTTPVEIPWP
jgi:hypothetical protein